MAGLQLLATGRTDIARRGGDAEFAGVTPQPPFVGPIRRVVCHGCASVTLQQNISGEPRSFTTRALFGQSVQQCPRTPPLDTAADQLSGHVWVQELPTGGELRFQLAASGLVRFATAEGTYEAASSVPVPYRRAAAAITDRLDRGALRAATGDTQQVTFCGVATWNEGVPYGWASLPAFVGTDVRSDDKATYLSPDTATGVFDRLGLATLPAIEKELSAAHTDFSHFEDPAEFPQSAWHDGRAAGVLIRDKAGGRAEAWRRDHAETDPAPTARTADELAAEYATTERIERTIERLGDSGGSPTVTTIRDRLVADLARESYATLYPDGIFVVDMDDFRSAVAERVQQRKFDGE